MNEKQYSYVTRQEHDSVGRSLLIWFNEYPDLPVTLINYETLSNETPSMSISAIQGTYKTKSYLRGAYAAQYQFKLIYRIKPGKSNDSRLKADELLDDIAEWALHRMDRPDLGRGFQFVKFVINSQASMFARYEDESEDHQILMTMEYTSF